MAENVVVEERVLKRGGGAAITFAFIALVIALLAALYAVRAENHAQTATKRANDNSAKLMTLTKRFDNELGRKNAASTGAGVGPNTTNPLPNGNGQ